MFRAMGSRELKNALISDSVVKSGNVSEARAHLDGLTSSRDVGFAEPALAAVKFTTIAVASKNLSKVEMWFI